MTPRSIPARQLPSFSSHLLLNLRHSRVAKVALALLAISACLLLMQSAARIGFSRLLTRYAVAANSLPAADQAIQLTPGDPEAHRARATVLNRLRRPAEAEASLKIAASLRPRDDYLWLELGNTREELGDNEGALAAFNEAVRSAPYYAHTHWQRGNLLLRMGRHDDAFADLRQAAASNKKYVPNLIDLAWRLTGGDTKKTETLLQIGNDHDRWAFARFLAQNGRGSDAIVQLGLLTGPLSDENKKEMERLLVAARSFNELYGTWSGSKQREEIANSGFEEPLMLNGSALGWLVARATSHTKLAVDVSEKLGGQKSLQIVFDGEWDPGTPLLSQIVYVEPGKRYQLGFAIKTKDLVTGGPPRIVLSDATKDQILGRSDAFPQVTGSWQTMNVEFTTTPNSEAVTVRLMRESCASTPCPIFGTVWLDEFSVRKL